MLLGLSMFFVVHVLASIPSVRRAAVARAGENGWRGVVTINAFAGLGLVVLGWPNTPNPQLFAPSAAAIRLAPLAVTLALVLFVAGGFNFPGYLRARLHHPMVIGVLIWSLMHLFANGGLRETVLFGCFAAYSAFVLIVAVVFRKRAVVTPVLGADLKAAVIGLIAAGAVMHGHAWLFGVPALLPY
ncbi:NnrU family protein [Niveibacterium sp. 24ML]|nr:NnrU family protein [Niveibacterium sp. 24ML]